MKRKSVIGLAVVIVLLAGLGTLALTGARFGPNGMYVIKPLPQQISQGLDLRGGMYTVYQAVDSSVEDFDLKMRGAIGVLRNRLDAQGYTEATVTQQGSDRIRIEIPDVSDPEQVLSIIGSPARLEFKDPDGNLVMDGTAIARAEAVYAEGNQPVVSFELNENGKQAFSDATARLAALPEDSDVRYISIELDGTVISSPNVNQHITDGRGVIEGIASVDEVIELAMLIQSGALPLDLTQLEMRTISATLGVDALDTSILAGIIGVALIFAFMIAYYRIPGLVACLALCWYLLLLFFFMAVIPGVQLTLPGIAGIVLSIGMAVDANVIIFERFREEVRSGKSLTSSLDSGYKRALTAVIDANVTTIIAAAVLMVYGTGSIKGFAYTLAIGVVVSMFTAVVVTRFVMKCVLGLNIRKKTLFVPAGKKEAV